MTATLDLGWLDHVPADLVPDGYRDAVAARHSASARHEFVDRRISELTHKIRAFAHDPASDWASLPSTAIQAVAMELAAAREIANHLPPIPQAHDDADEQIAAAYARSIFGDLTVPIEAARLSAGVPPLYAAELKHAMTAHPREIQPFTHGTDLEAIEIFERICAENANVYATCKSFTAPLNGASVRDRIQDLREFADGDLAAHIRVLESSRSLIETANKERRNSSVAHRCSLWAGAQCATLDPVPPGFAWTLTWATSPVNGRPVEAYRNPVAA